MREKDELISNALAALALGIQRIDGYVGRADDAPKRMP